MFFPSGAPDPHRYDSLGIDQRHEHLHASEGVRPGEAEGGGAVFRQVVLPQEAVQAQHPRVLHRLGEDPHVRRAADVVVAVDQPRVPLHQPLQVYMVASRQGGGLEEKARQSGGGVKGQDESELFIP